MRLLTFMAPPMDSDFSAIVPTARGVMGHPVPSPPAANTPGGDVMSYDSEPRGDDAHGDDLRPEAVLFHRGDYRAPLKRHLADVDRALREGPRGVRSLAPH